MLQIKSITEELLDSGCGYDDTMRVGEFQDIKGEE
jgi:hypothetical protein